ncbi:hypothetical protein SBA6_500041 [Candidatus Sulfopaludibacter sp. SbA6]|nr:hypothetical protein SBA6_500041 [Candidatus Sulfopaludibacter sp. SbA6]
MGGGAASGCAGQHPDVAPDQYGATAHRVGPRVKAAAHAVHYGMGVPVRKLPAIPRGVHRNRSDAERPDQDALNKSEGVVGNAYQELRSGVATAPAVYTDGTGWRIHGQTAHLMTFDTDQATVFQIRQNHRNEEVREPIPLMKRRPFETIDAARFRSVPSRACCLQLDGDGPYTAKTRLTRPTAASP